MTGSALNPISQPIPPKSPLKSKTFWGAVLTAAAYVFSDYKNPVAWAEGIGGIVTAYGAREAISKNGVGA